MFWYRGSVEGVGTEVIPGHSKTVWQSLHSIFLVIHSPLSLPAVESELHQNLKDVHTALDALQYKVPKNP